MPAAFPWLVWLWVAAPAVALDPTWAPRAQKDLQEGRYAAAEANLRKLETAVAAGAGGPRERNQVDRGLAEVLLRTNRLKDALPYAERHQAGLERPPVAEANELLDCGLRLAEILGGLGETETLDGRLATTYRLAVEQGRGHPLLKLRVAALLAQSADALRHSKEVRDKRWAEVAVQAENALKLQEQRLLPASFRGLILKQMGLANLALRKFPAAEAALKLRAEWCRSEKDVWGEAETHVDAAELSLSAEDFAAAAERYRQALEATAERSTEKPLVTADILHRQATVLMALGDAPAARLAWLEASGHAERELARLGDGAERFAVRDRIHLLLRTIHQQLGRLPEALRHAAALVEGRRATFGERHPATATEVGPWASLLAAGGDFEQAERLLRENVAFWRASRDERSLELALALNNLAAVLQAEGALAEAETLAREALAIRTAPRTGPEADSRRDGAAELDLISSWSVLARLQVARGRYVDAIADYERALALCRARPRGSDSLRSSLLLDLATAYKSQGLLSKASACCRESLEIQQRSYGKSAFSLVPHLTALAALARAERDPVAARDFAEQALTLCKRHRQESHPLAAAALNHLGGAEREAGHSAAARKHWEEAVGIFAKLGQRAAAARILNNLGMLEFENRQFAAAHARFVEAEAGLGEVGGFPQEHYGVLCNLAATLQRLDRTAEALPILERAVALAEIPRQGTVGAEDERAQFFTRFSSAFDLLVQLNLQRNEVDGAFLAAERSRNRTFLDQLRLSGVDVRETLPPSAAPLLAREKQLGGLLAAQRTKLRLLGTDPQRAAETKVLADSFATTQTAYAEVWKDIRSASPLYRSSMAEQERLLSLTEIRKVLFADDEAVLFYYLSPDAGWVLLIPPGTGPVETFPLLIRHDLNVTVAAGPVGIPQGTPGVERGSQGTVIAPKTEESVAAPETIAGGPLTRQAAGKLTTAFLQDILRRWSGTVRGSVGLSTAPKLEETPDADFTGVPALTETFLPAKLRARLKELAPRRLIIVPDGPLHQLPFEALPLAPADGPRFVLDEFPPIAYAPSAHVLLLLHRRSSGAKDSLPSVLTVGHVEYDPQAPPAAVAGPAPDVQSAVASSTLDVQRAAFDGLGMRLAPLPESRGESVRIAAACRSGGAGSDAVVELFGSAATEAAVRRGIRGKRFIHLATHGLVDDRLGNLFGAIALAPPAAEDSQGTDDGFLSLAEIHTLPLAECELAVLSACRTNVGTDRPLESASSLARGFLAAGARRVVASHWSVADRSTAELIGTFFEHIVTDLKRTNSADYAAALHAARLSIRRQPRFAAPFYWAPFVLLGPATDRSLSAPAQ